MSEPESLPIAELRRVRLRPGEVLVAKVPNETSHATIEYAVKLLEATFPDNKVLVVVQDVALEVISPEDAAEEP